MTDQFAELALKIEAPDIDANTLDDLTRQLQDEIRELEVESVKAGQGWPYSKRRYGRRLGSDW